MQGSWNPLGAQSTSFGSFGGSGGFGGTCNDSMWGGGFGSCNSSQLPSFSPHNVGPRGPGGQPQQGQRRNKIKQRGREGGGGQAVASRRPIQTHVSAPPEHGPECSLYSKIRLKLSGARPWGSSQQKLVPDAKKQSKKRPAKEEDSEQRQPVKRGRSDRKLPAEEDEEQVQAGTSYKHAKDRPAELENNRFEPGQLVEIQQGDEWKLAVVRAFSETSGYTIQLDPVEQNRHKQTGVTFNQLRMACMHADCRCHAVPLARDMRCARTHAGESGSLPQH